MDKFDKLKRKDQLKSTDDPRSYKPIIICVAIAMNFAVFEWININKVGTFILWREPFNESLWEII